MEMKKCSKCQQVKDLSEFHKNRAMRDGYQHYCKGCSKQASNRYWSTPEGKARKAEKDQRHYRKTYSTRDGRKRLLERNRRFAETEAGRAMRARIYSKWLRSEKGKRYRQEKYRSLIGKAWLAVHTATANGALPRARTLKCSHCTHRADGYHHHRGYAREFWLDVVPLCTKCHKKAEG